MRKLKLFLLLFIAAVAAGNFTACKNKDDNNTNSGQTSSSIIGTWVGSETLTFNSDGSFIERDGYETTYGSYSFYGSTLTLSYPDGHTEIYRVKISGNTLTLDGKWSFIRR